MNTQKLVATEQIIEALVASHDFVNPDLRAKYLFRESLRNLVRLAKAEQLMEIRKDVARAVSPVHGIASSEFTTRP